MSDAVLITVIVTSGAIVTGIINYKIEKIHTQINSRMFIFA